MRIAIAVVGASGSGKTRLVARLVRHFRNRRLKVGTIKHAHHGFAMDRSGKDSWRHFEAGALRTCVTSRDRTAVFERHSRPRQLRDLLRIFRDCDVVLVEGFRSEGLPALEVYRRRVSAVPLFRKERFRIRGLVTDDPTEWDGPRFSPADVRGIARFILSRR